MIIKRKKLSEKTTTNNVMTPSMHTPPGLSHSLPTSATYSENLDRTRSASIDSSFSIDFAQHAPGFVDYSGYGSQIPSAHSNYPPIYPEYSTPYSIESKTEQQYFVDDNLLRCEELTSTFQFVPPPPDAMAPSSYPGDGQFTEEVYSDRRESDSEGVLDMNYFEFNNDPSFQQPQAPVVPAVAIPLEENDQRLLDHFVANVVPSIFPVLETNPSSPSAADLILPALATNKCYLHCCLSISAQHLKATHNLTNEAVDNDIMRHRYATISELCAALNHDEEHQQILDATLGMIFFQCSVGRADDSLPDIPWHQHFQAAISLVQKLNLTDIVSAMDQPNQTAPFAMTLTSWIDILGASMQGKAPVFAHTYREKHLNSNNSSLGLKELMGCEDRVMYLISEIACLEALKCDGMDDIQLCHHVHSLGDQIGLTEMGESGPKIPFGMDGRLNEKQLSKNITAAFRLAARIYLCSLVPGFSPSQASCKGLVAKLASVLEFIPSGVSGFDKSMVWVYLIGGSVSVARSSFRQFFDERVGDMGQVAGFGAFGQARKLLGEVWAISDSMAPGGTEANYVSWRDVMQMRGWDFLLI